MSAIRSLTRAAPRYDSGPNMTPLVDVVMVILIFLMLAGNFSSAEHFLATRLPVHFSGPASPAPVPTTMPRMLDAFISVDGNVTMNGHPGAFVDPEQFKAHLQTLKAALGDGSEVEIVLRPVSGEVPWDVLAPLYDAALRAGYKRICFAMTGAR